MNATKTRHWHSKRNTKQLTRLCSRVTTSDVCFKKKTTYSANKTRIKFVRTISSLKNRKCKKYDIGLSKSDDSVIYVGTTNPPSKGCSIIDLTKSDSEITIKREVPFLVNANEADIVTICSVKNLYSTSSEDIGLVGTPSSIIFKSNIYNKNKAAKVFVQAINSSDSFIELRRTYTFTSITNLESSRPMRCNIGQWNINDNEILIDNITTRMATDLGGINLFDLDLSNLNVDAFIELYRKKTSKTSAAYNKTSKR